MSGIASADFSKQGLTEVPIPQIRTDTSWLILSDNKIKHVPQGIRSLRYLTRLALNDNRIESIDPAIGLCLGVSWIDLTRNKLRTLPKELGYLTKITGLGLSENEFEDIPECVYKLKNLRKFGFFSNRITRISPAIQNLQCLIKVDLSNNQLEYLPDEFCQLRNISWLNLSNNRLRKLPAGINRLTRLEELGLGTNELTDLPDFSSLTRLRIFPIFKNRLSRIHPSLFSLPSIEKLDFSDNFISEFPVMALHCSSLRYLNLRNNYINNISSFHLQERILSPINMLDISENNLKYLPYRLFKAFSETTTIRLGDNPYERLPDVLPRQPSLLQICFSKILSKNEKVDPWIENIFKHKHICDYCRSAFVVDPIMTYCHSYLDSNHRFVIEKILCSVRCRRRCSE